MALQDLTPQLRTRLSRMERAVGWFVLVATVLLLVGFGYYLYSTAQAKGWFLKKISYQTCVSSAAGLKVGDPVKLMGRDVGDITDVILNDPYDYYNLTIEFRVRVDKYNYPGYIWSDSKVKVNSGDLLGNRYLEIMKGVEGVPTVLETTNHEAVGILRGDVLKAGLKALKAKSNTVSQALATLKREAETDPLLFYTNHFSANPFFLDPLDSPALTERLEKFVGQIESALPNVLNLTNLITTVLSNSASLTSNLNTVALSVNPAVSNLTFITAQLKHPGALGEWLLPTNANAKVDSVMSGADVLLANANTNLVNLNLAILNLADITSNLNAQVQANSNILSGISTTVRDADSFVQGLKHHWLLRSAFKKENEKESEKKK